MVFAANVIQVMIASPNEMEDERSAFRDAISGWNALNARNYNTMLLPITWELDIAPELGAHPQDLINNRLLENADILVAAFWMRVGTQTKRARGGAIEEVQLQLKRKKPVLLYFSDIPAEPSKMDSRQMAHLALFKKWASEKGLHKTYRTIEEFSSCLLRDIHLALTHNNFLKAEEKRQLPSPAKIESPLSSLKTFSRELLKSLGRSKDGRAFVKRSDGAVAIEINGVAVYSSPDEQVYRIWIDEIVSLIGQNLIKDVTSRGEIFSLTESGRIVSRAND